MDEPASDVPLRSFRSEQSTVSRDSRQMLNDLFATGLIDLRRGALFDADPPPCGAAARPRIEGMLLGLAIGDALGNTSESLRPGERRSWHGEIRDYLPNPYADGRPVGLPSDDTQLAFWTLEQLLADDGLDPENLAQRFASRQIFGLGSTVREFLLNHRDGLAWHRCGPQSAGNGALMRIAPVLVPHVARPSTALWADTALAAMLTHNDAASTSACLALVRMLWERLGGAEAPAPDWWLATYVETARDLEGETRYRPRGGRYRDYEGPLWRYAEKVVWDAWRRGLGVREACNDWYSGAFVLETVPSVLYILMLHGDDPEEAIVRAVNDTKDNDTVAAIVGAVMGATHGVDALPKRWRDGLLGRTGGADDGRVFELVALAQQRWLGGDDMAS